MRSTIVLELVLLASLAPVARAGADSPSSLLLFPE